MDSMFLFRYSSNTAELAGFQIVSVYMQGAEPDLAYIDYLLVQTVFYMDLLDYCILVH